MSVDILGIGENALLAFQYGAAICSKNIANSGDPDYSREIVEYSSLASGVSVDVRRISDHFLSLQQNRAQSQLSNSDASSQLLTSIDQFVTGLNGSDKNGPYNLMQRNLQNFFDSLSGLSTSVTSTARQNVISHADVLASTLNQASKYINQQLDQANQQITANVGEINDITGKIAKLNSRIQQNGEATPEMSDQQEKLLNQLAQFVSIRSVEKNGMLNVYLQNGSSIIVGQKASTLSTARDEFNDKSTLALDGIALQDVNHLSGSLGGYLNLKNSVIPNIQRKIGVFSETLVSLFNKQNAAGYVAPNTAGGNIFDPIISQGKQSENNTGNAEITASIDPANINALIPTAYTITATAGGQFEVMNTSTGTKTLFNSFPINIDGLTFSNPTGTMNVGDSFLVDPSITASSSVKVVAGPNDIALSSKIDGTGNGNLNALISLGTQSVFDNNQDNFTGKLANTFSELGTLAKTANDDNTTASIVFQQAKNDKQSVSGVNTQEEYTNLIHFQQSYSAASKIIAVDQKLFDSLASATGL